MAALLWDVQEEHLAEAEFVFEMWETSLDSPIFTLPELRAGPEERLWAHIDALVVGGSSVLEGLVMPVLDDDLDDDRFRTGAAALAILDGAGREGPDIILGKLDGARAEGRAGLMSALHLSRRTDLVDRLSMGLADLDAPRLADRLEGLARRGVDVGKRLAKWLTHEDLAVQRVAARLARHSSSSRVLRRLLPLMSSDDPGLRANAIESALIRGLPGSWQAAYELAFHPDTEGPLRRTALSWAAMQGDAAVHARILAMLARQPDADLLWAASVTGRPDAVAIAVELVEDDKLARLAGEVVSSITGLPVSDDQFWLDEGAVGAFGAAAAEALPELDEDDLDADLVPPAEQRLRLPRPEAIRSFWEELEPELSPALRYLDGRPIDTLTVEQVLRGAPMRRRHVLAVELALRSAGVALLDTRASAVVQRRELAALFATLSRWGTLDWQGGLPII